MADIEILSYTGERIVPEASNCEPNFASRMYHEHMARYLFAAQCIEGKAVLDVGCGVGYGSQKLAQLGAKSVTAFDISQDAIKHAQKFYTHPTLQYSVGNAEKFTFQKKFDIVTCFEMIEHVKHPRKVLECIAKHLKDDGIIFVSTPRFLGIKRTHFHETEYTFSEFHQLIEEHFGTQEAYVENNHFTSLVTRRQPDVISHLLFLKDQFSYEKADVFLVVATPNKNSKLPEFTPSLVVDDDSYVTMLEKDVEILHKAEDDLRASFKALEVSTDEALNFKDKEILRLEDEYRALSVRAEEAGRKQWEEYQVAKVEIDRLSTELNLLREIKKAHESVTLELVRQSDELQVLREAMETGQAEAERLTADRNALQTACDDASSRLLELTMKHAALELEHAKTNEALESVLVQVRDAESRRLEAFEFARSASDKANGLQRELDTLKRDIATVLETPDSALTQEHYDSHHRSVVEAMERVFLGTEATHHIIRDPLVLRANRMGLELVALRERARQAENALREQQAASATAEAEIEAMRTHIQHLDLALDQAQGAAAASESQIQGMHRHIQDLDAALEQARAAAMAAEDEVQAMRVHVEGLETDVVQTRRSLESTSAELRVLQHTHSQTLNQVAEQRARAERAEAFAEDWHAQILSLRQSPSWRMTRPLRAITKPFRG